MRYLFILATVVLVSYRGGTFASERIDVNRHENQNRVYSTSDTLWLMGSFSVGLYGPQLDTLYIQDFGDWGIAFKVGGMWYHQVIEFNYHSETENLLWFQEHRSDYAVLYGLSHQGENCLWNIMGGLSMLDYLRRGNQLTPPSTPGVSDATYQMLRGTALGIAGSVEFYFNPIRYWGIFGMGLYGCLNRGNSYFALEFSLVELQAPISLH